MSVDEIILQIEKICRKNRVEHLSLFGSYATRTAAKSSDLDFVVYGCKNIDKLTEEVENIEILQKIDLFFMRKFRMNI